MYQFLKQIIWQDVKCILSCFGLFKAGIWLSHRDILIEATSRQKVFATSVSKYCDQGGAPTLVQWPQCSRVWKEIEIFQISDQNINHVIIVIIQI